MALLELKKEPSPRDLAWFGVIMAAFGALVATMLWWTTGNGRVATYILFASLGLGAAYYAVPPVRRPMFSLWMRATYPIGWVMSHALLAGIYFILFAGIGVVMGLLRYDPLARRIDRTAASYWIRRTPNGDVARYFRQY